MKGHFLLSIDPFDQKLVCWLCCPTWLKTNNSKAKLHPSLPQLKSTNIHKSFFPIKSLVHFNVRITSFNHCFTMLSESLSSFIILSYHPTAYGWVKLYLEDTGIKSNENHTCTSPSKCKLFPKSIELIAGDRSWPCTKEYLQRTELEAPLSLSARTAVSLTELRTEQRSASGTSDHNLFTSQSVKSHLHTEADGEQDFSSTAARKAPL